MLKYSRQQVDTKCGRFKLLALRTMAGDKLEYDVNSAISCCNRSSIKFFMSLGSYDRNQHCM